MARQLTFQYGESTFAFEMQKVDRDKLYGFKESEVLDDQGRVCELATLANDGCTLVGRGGTGIGYRSATGLWCDKKSLKPLNLEGREIQPVASSFEAPIELTHVVDVDTYLNHNLRSIYVLQAADDAGPIFEELKNGTIFSFSFSYRGGLEADTGFLLAGQDGNIFFAIGSEANLQFVGLGQSQGLLEEEDTGMEDSEDLMDFGMI